jgi:hypothetical protein
VVAGGTHRMKRIVVGFLVAPLVPAGVLILFALLVSGSNFRAIGEGLWVLFFSALVSYPVAAVFGLPILFFALRYGFVSWYHSIAFGLLIGWVIFALFNSTKTIVQQNGWWTTFHFSDPLMIMFCVWGATVTLAFWVIARPDHYYSINSRK